MKKSCFILVLWCLVPVFLYGQNNTRNSVYDNYIRQYSGLAVEQMNRHGIPASITLAQGLLESGAGRSDLATRGNNHFGIKCHSWTGRTIYHDDDEAGECFRAYSNPRESYEDHSLFLVNGQRYRRLFSLGKTDYKGWAKGLSACGYATDPQYANRLISLIERYELYNYDTGRYGAAATTVAPTTTQPAANPALHTIEIYNKNYYLRARRGDTFKSLAQETGISARKLASANELSVKSQLEEGQIIYLKKKQKKALPAFKNRPHVVAAGQSMYDISQMYGIRVKSLYKMNHLADDYVPMVGDRLRVR